MKGRASTFGGRGFRWRTGTLQEDMGEMWSRGTCSNEGMFLHSVTLADPGTIYDRINDPNEHLLLEFPNTEIFRHQFEQLVACYERLGIVVHQLPPSADHPNWIFQRDLFNATPWGVVLARPASQQRSGEEVSQQLELAKLRVPIVMMPTGHALFEGPDMLWVNAHTALVANNRRSTPSFFTQFHRQFPDVSLVEIPLPEHSQHLLGILNFLSPDHVAIWEDRFPAEKVSRLRDIGLRVTSLNCHSELQEQRALKKLKLI